jgi:hypothetical protein
MNIVIGYSVAYAQVSAEGIASEWGVWPLVGLRVPANATLEPLLTLYNPTDRPVQVRNAAFKALG